MTMHSQIRAKSNEALTEDQLRRFVPSLFAEAPHDSRSDRYAYIPSIAVMRGLEAEGFLPVAARQSRTRDESRTDFTKHMVRFRKADAVALAVGDTIPEIVLVNSHDGTSSYNLMAGLFRLVCLNGMVVSAGDIANIRVQHTGKPDKIVSQVIEGAYTVLDESVKALEAPKAWSRLQLTHDERQILAEGDEQLPQHRRFSCARRADDQAHIPVALVDRQFSLPMMRKLLLRRHIEHAG